MATTIVKNHAEHDIVLQGASKEGIVRSVTLPAASTDSDPVTGKDKLVPSETEVDDDTLAAVTENCPVAKHYFDEAILRKGESKAGSGATRTASTMGATGARKEVDPDPVKGSDGGKKVDDGKKLADAK